MFSQKKMDETIAHARANPIVPRGRTSIGRMAALITDGETLNQLGLNRYKSHPLMYKFSKDHNKICLHAEIDALAKVISFFNYHRTNLKNLDIYVARVLKNDTPALAKPCDTCMGALSYFGIRNIYWTK